MPTYDYQCRSCGTRIEVIHSMTDPGPDVCEVCGGELRRILYPAGIIFKGTGFYSTDSRAGGSTAKAPSDGAAKTGAADTGGKSGESASTGGSESAGTTSSSSE